jgi:hypothetical protein
MYLFSRVLAPGALGGAVGGRGQIDAKIAAVNTVICERQTLSLWGSLLPHSSVYGNEMQMLTNHM